MSDPELNYPKEIDLDRWSYNNQLGDLYALAGHACIGIFLILFFEVVIYRNCWARCFYCICQRCFKATSRQIEDAYGDVPIDNSEKKDDDVFEEEKRVALTKPKDMPVRVA